MSRRWLSTVAVLAVAGAAVWKLNPPLAGQILERIGLGAYAPGGGQKAASEQAGKATAQGAPKRVVPPAPVTTTKVTIGAVPVALEGVGSVQARSTVAIKARVDGQLVEAAVKEGQRVAKGDLLFRLDPRPFEAVLKQAEASLARDQANLEKARADHVRIGELAGKGYSPKAKFDEARANLGALEAAVRSSQAAIELARLNLEYSVIRAPISGQAGNILVHPGNMVKANDTQSLIMLTETDPVYVAFAVPERYLGELRRLMSDGSVKVEVWTPQDKASPATGELFFMNNAVDTTTGTITLMASVPNPDLRLTPGQFINARAAIGSIEQAIVVPTRAVQTGQRGTFVYVVKDDQTAEVRPVTAGHVNGDQTVIVKGLSAGETVVTDGQLRLFPGAKVAPRGAQAQGGKPKEQS